ncbi:hypothetical protein ACFYV5_32340 [Streptomyces sp. NPDC003035]|uniref:hypothetical protein n=1 Tax=Streptomyces sp. NPDC003035 TaxID=3364676 RepID=UPI0036AEED94
MPSAPVVAAAPSGPDLADEATWSRPPEPEPEPAPAPAPAPASEPKQELAPAAAPEPKQAPVAEQEPATDPAAASEAQDKDETGDEAIHTLLRTAATERPVPEVASLVARLQQTGELSSPADVALRAAAVSRPLDEVRQLVALLNESGYDLHQAETTLRAAAVGRPIEDVVALVNILNTDGSDWRAAGAGAKERNAGSGQDDGVKAGKDAVPVVAAAQKRSRGSAKWTGSALDGALAEGPGSHTASSALRSALRWPAAVAMLACGLVHVPTDLADMRAGSSAEMLSVVVTVLCLLCGVWLAVRDTVIVWAATVGLAIGVIVIHALESVGTVSLISSSLAFTYTWAKATALMSAVTVVLLAASSVVRYARTAGATDSA